MSQPIYLDNHSTTQLDPAVLEAMMPWLTTRYGNAGSISHSFGHDAKQAVDEARDSIAAHLNVTPSEIVFTSGATESNNLAIRGVADRYRGESVHFLSATTEHKAVLDPLQKVASQGHRVTLVSPTLAPTPTAGLVDVDELASEMGSNTKLASIMLVNNEIGVIQPIRSIAEASHQRGILLHCDATQAIGKIPTDVSALDADLLSFSGHKIYGPCGVGALIVRRRRPRVKLDPQIIGGGQEQGRRSGTLNVPGIVGLAKAVELSVRDLANEAERMAMLRDSLHAQIRERLDDVWLNGPSDLTLRVPGNLNLRFAGVDGEALMMNMGQVAASSGSACTSANPEPSHVLRALGLSEDDTRSSLRFGIGRFNTQEEIDRAAQTVAAAVTRLRQFK